jgi:hypothetical protein
MSVGLAAASLWFAVGFVTAVLLGALTVAVAVAAAVSETPEEHDGSTS